MTAKFSFDANEKHESKGDERTLAALFREVCEAYQDEEGEPLHTPAAVFALGCRTLIAKAEYHARVSKGLAPSRIYTARIQGVDKARKDAATVKDAARRALAKALGVKLPEPSEKPAKPAKESKPSPKPAPAAKRDGIAAKLAANAKRIHEIEAALAKPAKATAPAVRKANRSDVAVLDLLNNY